jgi:glycosyltransferase involved in cell wall biosynthesis
MAKVSVIVLAYQHGPYLKECLESVLAQRTTHALEILVGEDGSTDDTGAICDAFAARDPRIQVFHRGAMDKWRIDGHVTGRRNCLDLVERATGDYATLLDGDDGWLDPDRIEAQVALLEADRMLSGCYHHTRIMDSNGDLKGRWRPHLPPRMGPRECLAERAPFHTSAFLWRHTPAMRTRLTRGDAWTAGSYDMFLFACAADQGDLALLDREASFYRMHGVGLSSTGLFMRSNIHRLRILQWLRFDHATNGRVHDHIEALCDRHLRQVTAPLPLGDVTRWLRAMVQQPGYFFRPWRARLLLGRLLQGPRT